MDAASRPRRGTRRDRHGRGLRGPLAPPDVPFRRTRAETFDDLVLDAVEHLEPRVGDALAEVEFVVEDVPALPADGVPAVPYDDDPVPLGRVEPAAGRVPARIVVYRRPIEVRAPAGTARADLVHDVVVEQVATLLGLDPDAVDPPYDGD